MYIWTEVARTGISAGDEIILLRKNDLYEIRYNGMELMCSSCHQSEDFLAEKALRLLGRPARKVLIGGLGLGYTLRMVLNFLDDDAQVVVSEIVPEIVHWNRHYFGHLAGNPLDDPRVEVRVEDVRHALDNGREAYDVVLMDTDNGPEHLVRTENGDIYRECGIRAVERALTPGGIAAFWSSELSPAFEKRLDALPWTWRCDSVPLSGGRVDAFHHVYLASRDAANLHYPRVVGASTAMTTMSERNAGASLPRPPEDGSRLLRVRRA